MVIVRYFLPKNVKLKNNLSGAESYCIKIADTNVPAVDSGNP